MPPPTPTCLCFSSSILASRQRKLHFLGSFRCIIRTGCEAACCWLLTRCACMLSLSLLFQVTLLSALSRHLSADLSSPSLYTHPYCVLSDPASWSPTQHPPSQSCLTPRNPMDSHTAHSWPAWSRVPVLPATSSVKWTGFRWRPADGMPGVHSHTSASSAMAHFGFFSSKCQHRW